MWKKVTANLDINKLNNYTEIKETISTNLDKYIDNMGVEIT
jgi:hypothetical protein